MSYHRELHARNAFANPGSSPKKSIPKISGQHGQYAEPGQILRQSGSKPESTFTSQAQYRALPRGLWRIISAMQHTSEHNMQCINLFIYAPMLHECAKQNVVSN